MTRLDADSIAARLARCVELFRHEDAKQPQKAEFRALMGLLRETTFTLQDDGGRLVVNGSIVKEGVGGLVQRVGLHNVREIVIARDPPPGQVFELLKALADQPALGTDDIPTRLRHAGVDRVTVTLGELAPAAPLEAPDRLRALAQNPQAVSVGESVDALVHQVETALSANQVEQLLSLLAEVARSLERVPHGSKARRQYGVALKRVYTKALVAQVARLVNEPQYHGDAILALQGAGAGGVKVLIDLLVAAPTRNERRALFDALSQMKEGTDQLVHMLDHRKWFVIRNGAELVGELGLEEAVPALARQLEHEDERVRKAVAIALAKIGSGSAGEPLRRALRDKSAEVRKQVALGIGGRKSFALAMPLVVALEEEKDEAVERELILALGRIASPDAVQALIKFSQPGGGVFGRPSSALRLAAVEALRLAGTPPAVGTLEGLADDGDRQVRSAAQAALLELKGKPRA